MSLRRLGLEDDRDLGLAFPGVLGLHLSQATLVFPGEIASESSGTRARRWRLLCAADNILYVSGER